jgi:hypothetical protein
LLAGEGKVRVFFFLQALPSPSHRRAASLKPLLSSKREGTVRSKSENARIRTPRIGENRRYLARVNPSFRRANIVLGGFTPFSSLGTADAKSLAWPRDGPKAGSRRYEMTLSLNAMQSLALSLVGALVASSLFLSAAVGPVPVI